MHTDFLVKLRFVAGSVVQVYGFTQVREMKTQ